MKNLQNKEFSLSKHLVGSTLLIRVQFQALNSHNKFFVKILHINHFMLVKLMETQNNVQIL